MGRLYDIIQNYIDHQKYPPSVRQLAVDLGVSPTTVRNWRNPKDLPKAKHLEAVARVTGVPLDDVFDAAAFDAGYRRRPAKPPSPPTAETA
jgi:transcriptional regulator with XRE-family HTH domain